VFELDCADLVVIAGRVRGVDPGAALDQVDLAAARAALAAAKPPAPSTSCWACSTPVTIRRPGP
jgi:hypothetical protein